jgi:hypothetical protein
MVVILMGVAVLAIILLAYQASQAAATGGCQVITGCTITYDESTWPSGDTTWNVCRAIARAEGANIKDSNPDRLNNPGDISDGGATYGFETHSGSAVTNFPDKQTGWRYLYNKIRSAFIDETSNVYSPNMTWTQFAEKWAGDWQSWVANVTGPLNVSPDDRVGDYFGT